MWPQKTFFQEICNGMEIAEDGVLNVNCKIVYIVLYVLNIKVNICIGKKTRSKYIQQCSYLWQNHRILFSFSLFVSIFHFKKYIYLVNLDFYDPHFSQMVSSSSLQTTLIFSSFTDLPTQNFPFSTRASFNFSISIKVSLSMLIFSHYFQLQTFVIPHLVAFSSVQFSSVAQSCPTLCNPMNHSTPGLPVHHQLPEFTQTHVHRVSDAIQPSHPLSSPSPPAPSPSQHQSLFQ